MPRDIDFELNRREIVALLWIEDNRDKLDVSDPLRLALSKLVLNADHAQYLAGRDPDLLEQLQNALLVKSGN